MRLIDLHCDTIAKLSGARAKGSLLENPYSVDLVRMKAADSLVQCFSTFFFSGMFPAPVREQISYRIANKRIDTFEKNLRLCKEDLVPVHSYEDIGQCIASEKAGALLTLEDGVPIGNSIENLYHFYKRGIRLITLTWNYENAIGYPNSTQEALMQKGLKAFGMEVLEEMNRLGILADVSHLSDGGFWDVAKNSKKPFIASHSNARAVTAHPRNMTDEMIRAVAESGGVIGLNFCPAFLGDDGKSRISHMLRHIKHIYKIGGEDVLAVGTDFDGIAGQLQIDGIDKMYLLADALKKHKMPERIIEKMWSGNALRVFREVL